MINNLKELRLKKELTQKELSNATDIPLPSLSSYERGVRNPKINVWRKLAGFFNVSVGYLQGIDIETPSVTLKNDVPTEVIYKGKKYKVITNE